MQRGDILWLNCFPMISGYYTALERTLFCGEPSPEHLRLWEVNVEVHRRGLELIKPGAVCKDIAAELNEIYARHGLLPTARSATATPSACSRHYYGREAGLELREDIETVLEPGMVVSMEPMIMVPEGEPGAGGYREHDILVVGEDGAENITEVPVRPGAQHPRGLTPRRGPGSRPGRAGLPPDAGRVTSCGMVGVGGSGCTVADGRAGPPFPGTTTTAKGTRGHRRERGPGRVTRLGVGAAQRFARARGFSVDEPVLGVTEIARKVGLHKSTVVADPRDPGAGRARRARRRAAGGSGWAWA